MGGKALDRQSGGGIACYFVILSSALVTCACQVKNYLLLTQLSRDHLVSTLVRKKYSNILL